jgi:alginate O-acetyltransferase complex protein AlgI
MAPWIRLIVLDLGLFFFFKWLTARRALRRMDPVPAGRLIGYVFLWVGMNAKAFLSPVRHEHRPLPRDWFFAVFKMVVGFILVGVVLRHVPRTWWLLRDWTALVGLGLIVPFGLFHLMALGWQAAGVHARPIMDRPFWAVSLTEFWGRRWNLAVHDLMHEFAFRPWLARWGVRVAVAGVFILSGLFHELVLSLPAWGGFGLPTLFFTLQLAGVALERTATGKRLGLGRGWLGRVYVWSLTILPAYGVFHRAALDHVMYPWLDRLGVT